MTGALSCLTFTRIEPSSSVLVVGQDAQSFTGLLRQASPRLTVTVHSNHPTEDRLHDLIVLLDALLPDQPEHVIGWYRGRLASRGRFFARLALPAPENAPSLISAYEAALEPERLEFKAFNAVEYNKDFAVP